MKSSVINISPQEFAELSESPLLIDVRSQLEYSLSHATNASNISLPRILMSSNSWLRRRILPQWFQELPKDRPIALICLTAHRSSIAAQKLIKAGFTEVYNITGGMLEWQRLGLSTCRGSTNSN